ncbi:hypothetical protein N7462_005101 [Penicillium macrosclerotiorum]|uniref:uncharacterized protein n=1 Tax=Penicillium macrosclerotiorum TaxID=303699 RepID=UPI002549476F|nr:uncharacterized protein N7462_005101 [Penicillium macrosclerotiorum]KAJ5690709.1 hypothetical protein N7462_005101 [Penicillium macrosclerotiorum]
MPKSFITKVQSPVRHSLTLPTDLNPSPSSNPSIINDALNVRLKVFVGGQNTDPADEIDGDDARSWHWVTYDNEDPQNPIPVATIRLIPPPQVPYESLLDSNQGRRAEWPKYDLFNEPSIRLGRLACLEEYRGYGLGKGAIQGALYWAREHPTEINLALLDNLREVGGDERTLPGGKWSGLVLAHAQAHREAMYARLGFVTYGQLGVWEGFEHAGMSLRLDVKRESHL